MKLKGLPDLVRSAAESLSNRFSEWISKNFPSLTKLPEDVELAEIHGVFYSKSLFKSKRLYVAVEWADGRRSSLPIEMANLLAIGRTYSGKEFKSESSLERVTVLISRKEGVGQLQTHRQHLYQTDEGVVSIPSFELARTLFFHNRHLVHAAYTPNGLAELAFVDRASSPIKIGFPESTTYPVSYLATKRSRVHFVWLFFEHEARRSFFSIYQFFQQNTGEIAFNFSPPDLTGWTLELSISRCHRSGLLEVKRIEHIVDAPVFEKIYGVEIKHPKRKFKEESSQGKSKKQGKAPNVDIDPELDMGGIPAFGKRLHSHHSKGFSFNISGIYGTFLADGEEASFTESSYPREHPEEQDQAGLGLPERDGKSQEFDPVINQNDDFEEAEDLPHKFLMFEHVMKKLGQSKEINLESIKCGVFPEPTNNSRVIFQTKDQYKLRFFVAVIEVNQRKLALLEADTTSLDPAKGGSTLIMGLKVDALANFKEIIQNFSNNGAQWRHPYIRERTNCFVACRHPVLKRKGAILSEEEYKEKWVKVLEKKLRKVANQE